MSARDVVAALGGRWHGSYGTARCPSHDDRLPSLSVKDGDDGRLLVHCHAGCDGVYVLAALRKRGLMDHTAPTPHRERSARDDDAERRRWALDVWRSTKPTVDTPVEVYLRSRGLTLPVPSVLRYHAALRHTPTGLLFPAMVAGVRMADGQFVGIHRTYLKRDGAGKAVVSRPKMTLGPISGAGVWLTPPDEELVVTEGIETGLSIVQATGKATCAALSAGGIEALVLPAIVRSVIIAADHDERGLRAADQAAQQWTLAGVKVRIAMPPVSGMDFNDLLVREAADA